MNNPQKLTPMDAMSIGDLVNLTLGDTDEFEVLRVHGGWIYTRIHRAKNRLVNIGGGEPAKGEAIFMAPVFVPEPPVPVLKNPEPQQR